MKKSYIIFVLLVSFFANSLLNAQSSSNVANYRLAERFSPTKIRRMVFSTSVRPNWLSTGDKFWYSYKTSEGTFYYIVDLNSKSKRQLFDNHKMAAMLTKITKDPYDYQHLPKMKLKFVKDDTAFQFDVTSTQDEVKKKEEEKVDESDKENTKEKKEDKKKKGKKKKGNGKPKKKVFHLEYNLRTGVLSEVVDWKEKKDDPRWANISPDGETVIFARDYNLYWMDKENYQKALKDDKDSTIIEHQLTTDGLQHYSYGGGYTKMVNDSEKKVKEESEKRRGAWIQWSPDSKKFAMVRSDRRKVKELWVIDVLKNPRPVLEPYRYQMPGEKEAPQYEMWVFDMDKKEGKKIDVSRFADQSVWVHRADVSNKESIKDYVPSKWLSKSADKIYFTRVSRDLHKIDLCVADVNSGEIKVLIEERLNTYVEVRSPFFVNNEREIIHWSERDGWAHLYLYDTNGNIKRQLTSGAWHVQNIVDVDERNRVVYFTANGREKNENPYYEHLYRVNMDGSGLMLLNKGNFDNRVEMSDSKRYFINNYSRVNTVPASDIRDTKGNVVLKLEKADLSNLFAAGYKFPEPFKAKAADGITDIYGVIYKPFNFDSTKTYPLIEYVYPGPQTEAVNTRFSARMDNTDRLAQLGFVVITLGNRGGHPSRSKWYHNYGYGNLRDYGLADKKYVAEQLADRFNFIDIDRVGITGHSGGGFMSTAALCQYPDFFKVAVSSAGNHENNIYNRWWSEKHHGVKEKKMDDGSSKFIYDIEKNSQLAKNLKGKLLLVTGDIDNNVHPGNTIRMANALIKANKRFDFFIMPGQRHGFGSQREYFFWLKADYFCKHLIGDGSISTDIFEMRRERKITSSKKER
ncbi:MAG: S9 family peptidase [Bacteroidales bacterium]|jgi:dipeptidyl aminopeptidase/acylaminoacyl peptidase|nr:S9 family peptidase [Bacteroidales bacterium]